MYRETEVDDLVRAVRRVVPRGMALGAAVAAALALRQWLWERELGDSFERGQRYERGRAREATDFWTEEA